MPAADRPDDRSPAEPVGAPADAPAGHRTPFAHALRVYWEDTDAGGVVFYANYLKFFERARTEWLRALGVQQQALRDATGAIFIVAATRVGYRAPARLDDRLRITVDVRSAGRATLVFDQQAWRDDTLLAEGEIRVGCVDAGTFRPRRIPNEVLDAIGAAGAAGPPAASAAAPPRAASAAPAPATS